MDKTVLVHAYALTHAQSKPTPLEYGLDIKVGTADPNLYCTPDLAASGVKLQPAKVAAGDSIKATGAVTNHCKLAVAPAWYGWYLSADAKLDKADTLLLEGKLGEVAHGVAKAVSNVLALPLQLPAKDARILLVADNRAELAEANEADNVAAAPLGVFEPCIGDAREPDSTWSKAKPLAQGRTEDLTICTADKDWFVFDAKAGETVTVTIHFNHAAGDLDLRVWRLDATGTLQAVASSTTAKAPEQVSFVAKAGKHYVRVGAGVGGGENSYAISMCKAVGSKCIECTQHADCGVGGTCSATICKPPECAPGKLAKCDDGNACTVESCSKLGTCVHAKQTGVGCSDGDACTLQSACEKGVCVAGLSTSVTATIGDAIGAAGEVSWLPGGDELLLVGSERSADGKALRGVIELADGATGKPKWRASYGDPKAGAWQLASAVTMTVGLEILAAGWHTPGASAAVALSGQATGTRAWMVRVSASDGAVQNAIVSSEKGGRSAILRVRAIDGQLVGAGWAAADKGRNAALWVINKAGTWDDRVGWLSAGDDAYYDVVGVPGGLLAVGVDGAPDGRQQAMVRAYTPQFGPKWHIVLSTGTLDTVLRSAVGLSGGDVLVGGGANLGQTKVGPPQHKPWLLRLLKVNATTKPTLGATTVLSATTPQDPFFAGAATGMVRALSRGAGGRILAAGSAGSAKAKGGMDARWWTVAADGKEQGARSWGGPQDDAFTAIAGRHGRIAAVGSAAMGTAGSRWIRAMQTPAKADCDDGDACTKDACVSAKGCVHAAVVGGMSGRG